MPYITGQISSREPELHTGNITRGGHSKTECLSTGSQQGYLWLGLSSFIKTVTLILFFTLLFTVNLFVSGTYQIVSTNTPRYCYTLSLQPAHTSVSYEVQTQPVLTSRPYSLQAQNLANCCKPKGV